jgi:hypothetical protein
MFSQAIQDAMSEQIKNELCLFARISQFPRTSP